MTPRTGTRAYFPGRRGSRPGHSPGCRPGVPPSGTLWAEPRVVVGGVAGARRQSSAHRRAGPAGTAMSWELLFWLLALCVLILSLVQLLRFLRADADLTLLWAEWQGRRPGEQLQWSGLRVRALARSGGGTDGASVAKLSLAQGLRAQEEAAVAK